MSLLVSVLISVLWFVGSSHILCICLSNILPCSLSLILSIPLSLSLPPSLNAPSFPWGSKSSSLGVCLPPLPWFSGFSPPPPLASLSRLPEFPPLPATSQARPSISVTMPAPPAACHPPPPAVLAPHQPSHQPRCPGQAGEFLPVPGKNNWCREKGPQSPLVPAPLPRAWGSLPESAGPRQEALRFLASPRRPPDLAPAPRPTAQILFRRRSRWRPEEAQAERGFQGGQAWGFLSPGSGLRPPQWGPQVAGGAGVVVGSWGEGGAIRQGVWWPLAQPAWAGVTPTPGTAGGRPVWKSTTVTHGTQGRHEDAGGQGWRDSTGTRRSLGWDRWTWAWLVAVGDVVQGRSPWVGKQGKAGSLL